MDGIGGGPPPPPDVGCEPPNLFIPPLWMDFLVTKEGWKEGGVGLDELLVGLVLKGGGVLLVWKVGLEGDEVWL